MKRNAESENNKTAKKEVNTSSRAKLNSVLNLISELVVHVLRFEEHITLISLLQVLQLKYVDSIFFPYIDKSCQFSCNLLVCISFQFSNAFFSNKIFYKWVYSYLYPTIYLSKFPHLNHFM